MEIKMPYAVDQYTEFMNGINRTDVLRKTVEWLKKLVLYLLKCVLSNAIFVYRTLNTIKK
jgi:hypothetical protein